MSPLGAIALAALAALQDGSETRPVEGSFDRAVDAAVARGVSWLRAQQKADGSFGTCDSSAGDRYVTGPTAIAVLALLASNVSKFDPAIERARAHLRETRGRFVYELGLELMAYDALAAPDRERLELERMTPAERRSYRFPRELEEVDRRRVEETAALLASYQVQGLWDYGPREDRGDTSNTQFALLGLAAAARCGARIDPEVWWDSLQYFLVHQQSGGELHRYREIVGTTLGGEPRTRTVVAETRGWGYWHGEREPERVRGSTTCIGIASLRLCQEELAKPGIGVWRARADAKGSKIREAIRDALAWLDANFAVDRNPNQGDYLYTYLYSLERVGALTERGHLGLHDWYREGAEFLIRVQKEPGCWEGTGYSPEIPNTSFALLFLRRSTLPPVHTAGSSGR